MKRILAVLCLAAMLLGVMSACDIVPEHEHVFDTQNWSYDEDFHWRSCTTVGCEEKGNKAAHNFKVTEDEDGNPINKCKTCGATNYEVPSADEHDHEFDDELSYNENFHWYECIVDGCYEKDEKTEHVFGNPDVTYTDSTITIKYVCIECEYEKVEEQEVKTEVDDALAWDEVFKNFKLTNFTMDVVQIYMSSKNVNHCIVTENEVYYCIPDSREFYTVPNGDGTYSTYMRHSSDDPFTLLNDNSDVYLKNAQKETVLQISFEENFEKFTYDPETGSYVCDEVIEAIAYNFSGDGSQTIYCYNNVVNIIDGKISSIEASYYFDEKDEDMDYSFKYYNIGITVMEIPQSVIDNAIAEQE